MKNMEKVSKIIAISGEPAAGKSTALFAFGILGVRFWSLDYLIAKKYGTKIPSINMVVKILTEEIERCRGYSFGPFVFEIPTEVTNKTAYLFDEILLIKSNQSKQRLIERGNGSPGVQMAIYNATKTIQNDGSKIDLWKQVEDWLMEINRVDWGKYL